MNEKMARIIRDAVQIVINYIPSAILEMLFLLFIFQIHISFFQAFTLLSVPLAFYVFRLFLHKPLLYLPAHLAVLLAVLLMPGKSGGERIFGGVLTAVYLCLSMALHMEKDDYRQKRYAYEIPPAVLVTAVSIEYFAALYSGQRQLLSGMATAAVVLILGYYIVHYMTNYLKFFQSNAPSVRNMPKGKMLREGGIMTAVFTVTATLILYFCAKASFVDNWFGMVMHKLRSFVAYLSSLLPVYQGEPALQEMIAGAEKPDMSNAALPEAQTGVVAQLFDQTLRFLIIGMVICLAAGVIVSLVTAYLRGFEQSGDENEVRERLTKKETEKPAHKETGEKKGFLPFLSAGEKIRQIFAKTIRQRLDREEKLRTDYPVNAMTAREMYVLFSDEARKDYMEFTALYEKARYSPRECKSGDVKRARALAQRLRA